MKTKWEPYSFACLPFGAVFLLDKELCVKTSAFMYTSVEPCTCGHCRAIKTYLKHEMSGDVLVDAECLAI